MGRKYIGNHICVITKNANGSKSNNGVVIVAHGGKRDGKTFKLKGGAVYFYCPDGDTLVANTVASLEKYIPDHNYEIIRSTGSTDCPDYEIEKEVSYHCDDTSRSLGKKEIDRIVKDDPTRASQKGWQNYDSIEKRITDGVVKYDVVSIRNRWFSSGTTLSNVIKELKSHGYGYGEYHCHFCRCSSGGGDWNVRLQQKV